MTRKEEIKQAAESNLDVSFYTPQDGELLKETFYIGTEWADEHHKSPWISVKDSMPYNNKELLLEKFDCTEKLITRDDENNFYIQRMWKVNGFWKWEYPANITHWFAIPELPKE